MNLSVGVLDYEMGNLHSVAKALQSQGARVRVSSIASELEASTLLVVPGVGSFGAAMQTLSQKKLDDFVRRWIKSGRPYFGICLGLQLLFQSSEESPGIGGLGILPGRVAKFTGKLRIPHMGWNTIAIRQEKALPYFKAINSSERFYFVHSYFPVPSQKADVSTRTVYGKSFCSSVLKENIFATQFHPEKSGKVGLRLMKNVLDLVAAGRMS